MIIRRHATYLRHTATQKRKHVEDRHRFICDEIKKEGPLYPQEVKEKLLASYVKYGEKSSRTLDRMLERDYEILIQKNQLVRNQHGQLDLPTREKLTFQSEEDLERARMHTKCLLITPSRKTTWEDLKRDLERPSKFWGLDWLFDFLDYDVENPRTREDLLARHFKSGYPEEWKVFCKIKEMGLELGQMKKRTQSSYGIVFSKSKKPIGAKELALIERVLGFKDLIKMKMQNGIPLSGICPACPHFEIEIRNPSRESKMDS